MSRYQYDVQVELHTHSEWSDGNKKPQFLHSLAEEYGVVALAVVDHDTLKGAENLLQKKDNSKIALLSGVEITTYTLEEEYHILGYGIDISRAAEFDGLLREHIEARKCLVEDSLEMYREAGIMDVAYDDLVKYFDYPGPVLTILQVLGYRVEKFGLSHDEVRKELLFPGGVAYAKNNRAAYINTFEAIELIRDFGGIPVWAHPGGNFGKVDSRSISEKMSSIEEMVVEMKRSGLLGIEAAHSRQSEELTANLRELAISKNLIATAGSDWHGFDSNKYQFGSFTMSKKELELLFKAVM